MASAELSKGGGEGQGAKDRGVVRSYQLDGDAVVGEPGCGALEEGGRILHAFGGQQFSVG